MRLLRSLFVSLFLAAFAVSPLLAQEGGPDPLVPDGENNQTPETWQVRLDRPDPDAVIGADAEAADIFFVNMTPGWHITTGPAAIFYHPASTAMDTYRAEALIHLFDPQGRNEAFGLFLGGADLAGDAVAYDYFLIRNNGQFLIKRRTGAETTTIQDWTPLDAIVTYGPDSEFSVPNTLAVEVGADEVVFSINDVQAARLPRADVRTDGIVGLRVNHALNLHVEGFAVSDL